MEMNDTPLGKREYALLGRDVTHIAAASGKLSTLQLLYQQNEVRLDNYRNVWTRHIYGQFLSSCFQDGDSPLHLSVSGEHICAVEWLLSIGINVNSVNRVMSSRQYWCL